MVLSECDGSRFVHCEKCEGTGEGTDRCLWCKDPELRLAPPSECGACKNGFVCGACHGEGEQTCIGCEKCTKPVFENNPDENTGEQNQDEEYLDDVLD